MAGTTAVSKAASELYLQLQTSGLSHSLSGYLLYLGVPGPEQGWPQSGWIKKKSVNVYPLQSKPVSNS